jgi:hypothetical protein
VGQHITVTVRHGASPSVRIFDTNRSFTGMAIERYAAPAGGASEPAGGGEPAVHARSHRPPDVLAARLLALGAEAVTVYSNVVSVEAPPERWPDLEPEVVETIEHLFGYYGDEAGWSPDALRAIGVEPLPTPEPAA